MIKMLHVLVSKIPNSQVFFSEKKCELLSHLQNLFTFIFSAKCFSIYAIFNDQSFNDTLTNNIVNFEQLSSDINPLMTSRLFYLNSLDIRFNTMGIWLVLLLPCFKELLVPTANIVDPHQTPCSAASDFGIHVC